MSETSHDTILYPTLPTTSMTGEQCQDSESQRKESVCPATPSQIPKAPNRDSPNIGRKRDHRPAFPRTLPSPGHSVKMARIFQDAQVTLRNDLNPEAPAATKSPAKSRLPIPQRRPAAGKSKDSMSERDPFGNTSTTNYSPSKLANETHSDHAMVDPALDQGERSLAASPLEAFPETQAVEDVPVANAIDQTNLSERTLSDVDPAANEKPTNANLDLKGVFTGGVTNEPDLHKLDQKGRNFSIWDDEDDTDLYLARLSVPVPTPMASKEIFGPLEGGNINTVDRWLEDMLSASPRKKWRVPPPRGSGPDIRGCSPSKGSPVKLSPGKFHAQEAESELGDSDKENRKPSGDGIDKAHEGLSSNEHLLATIIATPQMVSRIPTLNDRTAEQQVSPRKLPSRFTHPSTPRGYFLETPRRLHTASKPVISSKLVEVQEDVKLSPDVELYRKANRPKRSRCPSFNDGDILESPERKVLGESKLSRTLTRAMAFCEDAEDFEFIGVKTATE